MISSIKYNAFCFEDYISLICLILSLTVSLICRLDPRDENEKGFGKLLKEKLDIALEVQMTLTRQLENSCLQKIK